MADPAADRPGNARGCLRWVLWGLLGVVILVGGLVASIVGTDWYVDRSARRFCNTIPIGSDISATTAKADASKVFWGPKKEWGPQNGVEWGPKGGHYTFFFFHFFIFDKAVCDVWINRAGKVSSKAFEVEYD